MALNIERDARNNRTLSTSGWVVVRIWECAVKEDAEAAADVVEAATRS